MRLTFTTETHKLPDGMSFKMRRDPEVTIRCGAKCHPTTAQARTVLDATKVWNDYAAQTKAIPAPPEGEVG